MVTIAWAVGWTVIFDFSPMGRTSGEFIVGAIGMAICIVVMSLMVFFSTLTLLAWATVNTSRIDVISNSLVSDFGSTSTRSMTH